MALTAAQIVSVRRYAGYQLGGSPALTRDNDVAFVDTGNGFSQMTLAERLSTLTADEETVLTTYLTNLATLEAAILTASDNLDTDKAAVWEHNKNEVADRNSLFDGWRRRMCAFVGIIPGPGLESGGASVKLVRA